MTRDQLSDLAMNMSVEIDVLSAASLPSMHRPLKRARSIEELEFRERPVGRVLQRLFCDKLKLTWVINLQKRPTIITSHLNNQVAPSSSSSLYVTRSRRESAQSSRYSSEDRVRQEDGLSIDSPLTMSTTSSETHDEEMEEVDRMVRCVVLSEGVWTLIKLG
jgi:hypothetical protein